MRERFRTIAVALLALLIVATVGVLGVRHRARSTTQTAANGPATTLSAPTSTGISTTVTPAPSTTASTLAITTTNPGQQGLQKTDLLERQQPFVQVLPHETTHYRVDYHPNADRTFSLEITLYAILNNADQLPAYTATLKQYKTEALDWIRSQGQDPAAFKTTYKPPMAATL